jgi:hypothetical protein
LALAVVLHPVAGPFRYFPSIPQPSCLWLGPADGLAREYGPLIVGTCLVLGFYNN